MKKLVYQIKETVTKQIELNANVIATYITKLTGVEISADELMKIWDAESPEMEFRGTKFDFSIEHPLKCTMQKFVDVVLDLIHYQAALFEYEEEVVNRETEVSGYSVATIDVGDHIRVTIPDTTIMSEGIVERIEGCMLYGTWGDFGVNCCIEYIKLLED